MNKSAIIVPICCLAFLGTVQYFTAQDLKEAKHKIVELEDKLAGAENKILHQDVQNANLQETNGQLVKDIEKLRGER